MILDILKNKIAAGLIFATAGGAAVSLVYQTLPPEDDVYRVTVLHGDETTHIADLVTRSGAETDLLCHMQESANHECRYKSGAATLYIRGDARDPGGFAVVVAGVWDDPSQHLTRALIEDLAAGFVFFSPPMWRGKGGWKYHLTMKRLTPEEVAEIDRPKVAGTGE